MDRYYEELVFNVSTNSVLENLQGVPHFVVPTVGLKEGVFTGSQGAIYYPWSEISKSPGNWDHKPAVVRHPSKNGKAFTAADKDMIDKYRTGILLNTSAANNKLTFKTWIEEKRIAELSPKVYTRIKKKEKVEVSTGMTMDIEKKKGVFNGRSYIGIARNIQPDHLAILPDTVGACSVEDGAGLFATNESGCVINPSELYKMLDVIDEGPRNEAIEIIKKWMVENEMSFTAVQREIASELASRYGEKGRYWNGYIRDMFNNRVVFYDADGKLYQVGYTIKDDEVTLNEERKEVQVVTQYQPVGNDSTEPPTRTENHKMPIKPERVAVVIGTKDSGWEAKDKDWLTSLDDDQFGKIEKAVLAKVAVINEKTTEEEPPVKKKKKTTEEYLKEMPPDIRATIQNGLKADKKERERCIKVIVANKKNKFAEDILKDEKVFTTEHLQNLAELAQDSPIKKKKRIHNDEDDEDEYVDELLDEDEDELEADLDEEIDEDEDEEEDEKPARKAARIGQGGGALATNERRSSGASVIAKPIDWSAQGKK